MTQTIISNYFKDIATRFVPISHNDTTNNRFCVIDDDIISDEIKRTLDFSDWCLLLEEVAPEIRANDSNHYHEYYTLRFTVCKDVSRHKAELSTIKETSIQYAKAIFARIIQDYEKSKKIKPAATPFALKNIQFKANFEYYQNILEENLLGTDCTITIYDAFNCQQNDPALWN